MILTKLAETQSTLTLGWTPPSGILGYRFSSAASPKFSHTWDATRSSVKFSKASWYKVEALAAKDAGTYPPVGAAVYPGSQLYPSEVSP